MCYAIAKIHYRSITEPYTLLPIENNDDLDSKINEIKDRPEVQSVTVFVRAVQHKLVTEWRTEDAA